MEAGDDGAKVKNLRTVEPPQKCRVLVGFQRLGFNLVQGCLEFFKKTKTIFAEACLPLRINLNKHESAQTNISRQQRYYAM